MDEVCSWLTRTLFPKNVDITVTSVKTTDNALSIEARASGGGARCPDCSQRSQRVHGSYWRNPADLPAAGLAVRLRLLVRRFLCPAAECGRRTFAEQMPGLNRPHSRASSTTAAKGSYSHALVSLTGAVSKHASRPRTPTADTRARSPAAHTQQRAVVSGRGADLQHAHALPHIQGLEHLDDKGGLGGRRGGPLTAPVWVAGVAVINLGEN